MKKLTLVLLALSSSFLATAQTVKTGDAPFPTCSPCDWVRSTTPIVKTGDAPFPTCSPCDWVR